MEGVNRDDAVFDANTKTGPQSLRGPRLPIKGPPVYA